MAIRKRSRTMPPRRRKRMPKRKQVPVVEVSPVDVAWWAKHSFNPMFQNAVREIHALRGNVRVLWPKGAKRLIVEPVQVKAVRKRTRKIR